MPSASEPGDETFASDKTVLATDPGRAPTLSGPVEGQLFAGRYRIERRLGQGGMGSVYAAYDEEVGERVAIKVLTADVGSAVERFRSEVRLARRVTHRNAARTFDLGEHDQQRFITMELVDGESLHDRIIREGRLPVRDAVQIALQICHGLSAAHAVGVVHRDLKPANVLLESTGRVVVTDFGIARALNDDDRITRNEQALLGTPAYIAPEQLESSAVDGRADLFALGVILYEMLTGKRPFEAEGGLATALARLTEQPVHPREYVELPEQLATLIMRCLSRSPAVRPADAEALAGALGSFADAAPTVATAAPSSPPTRTSYVSTSVGSQALAIMPFKYRGPPDDAYLAESLTDELVDLLSMTRGLRVLGLGATARYADERDPQRVGAELCAHAVIDGTVQRARDRIRISARLVEASSGIQRWSERFEGPLEDVFDLQDRMAKQVVEAMRMELVILGARARVSAEAVELYLRARNRTRDADLVGRSLEEAVELLDRCLEMAPDFAPALAVRAEACVRRWFLPSAKPTRNWEAESRQAVERALAGAAELAETHLAAARLAVSSGEFEAAARALSIALRIAPTYAAAREYLGFLQCEAGRSDEGVRHVRIAAELDPTLGLSWLSVMRHLAMRGDVEAYRALVAELEHNPQMPRFALSVMRLRIAGWTRDRAELDRVSVSMTLDPDNPAAQLPRLMRRIALEDEDPAEMESLVQQLVERLDNPRFEAMTHQYATEAFAVAGAAEPAMRQLRAADASGVLVDADWLDRCPALASLRDRADFSEIRDRVRARADAIWRSVPKH